MKSKAVAFICCFTSLNLAAMWEKDFLGHKNNSQNSLINRAYIRSDTTNSVTLELSFSLRKDYLHNAERLRQKLRKAGFKVPPPSELGITDFVHIIFLVGQKPKIGQALKIIHGVEEIDENTMEDITSDITEKLFCLSIATNALIIGI